MKKADIDSKVLCEECSEPIPLARLEALPSTKFCVMCMEDMECRDKIEHVRSVEPQIRGTVRHRMEFEVEGREEVESIQLHIRRSN